MNREQSWLAGMTARGHTNLHLARSGDTVAAHSGRLGVILAIALAPWPALACDLGGSYASIEATMGGAEVYVQNNLAPGPLVSRCEFTVDGVGKVTVGYVHRPNDAPDSVVIVPPPGFIAVPPDAILQEGEARRFLIVPEVIG